MKLWLPIRHLPNHPNHNATQSKLYLQLDTCLAYTSFLKMEAVHSFKTSTNFYVNARCNIPKESTLPNYITLRQNNFVSINNNVFKYQRIQTKYVTLTEIIKYSKVTLVTEHKVKSSWLFILAECNNSPGGDGKVPDFHAKGTVWDTMQIYQHFPVPTPLSKQNFVNVKNRNNRLWLLETTVFFSLSIIQSITGLGSSD
jgi:hypothetical protein